MFTSTHCVQACSLHRFLHFAVGAFPQSLHHLVAVFQVVFVLVLLHFRRRGGSWCLHVWLPLVCAAGTAGIQRRGLLAGMVAAGCRVLQTTELEVVAGVHCASAVCFTSAHPLRALCAPVRSSLGDWILNAVTKKTV